MSADTAAPALYRTDFADAMAAMPASVEVGRARGAQIWAAIKHYLRHQLPRTIMFSLLAVALGYVVNVWLIGFVYDGIQKVRSGPGDIAAAADRDYIWKRVLRDLLDAPASPLCPTAFRWGASGSGQR